MAMGDKWNSRTYPAGCRGCGQTQLRHIGKGLCNRCYRAWAPTGEDVDAWLLHSGRDVRVPIDDEDDLTEEVEGDSYESTEDRPVETRPGYLSSGSAVGERSVESPPGVKKRRGIFSPRQDRPPKVKVIAPKTKERPPSGVGRRVSAADTVSDLWSAVGGLLQRAGTSEENPVGRHAPLGRYLAWQSQAAGEIVDESIKGTFIDNKVLQPAVRARSSLDSLAAVIGPPVIIFAIERNPKNAQTLLPLLESSIRASLPTLLPAMKKAKDREEKVAKAVAELFPDMAPGVDPVHEVIETMFAGFFNFVAESENETDARVSTQ